MATPEERMQILKMIESRQISAEEGARLLAALDKTDKGPEGAPAGAPRWFRVRITDLRTGKNKASVNIPMSLVEVGIKMGARFAPEMSGIDVAQISKAIREGAQGKIADIEDDDDAERVEIFIE